MKNKYIDILLEEYKLVNEHWMLATRQKAIIIQVTGSIVVALLGASYLERLPWSYFALITPVLICVSTFIYTQKEADFWAAAICLESIEATINNIVGMDLLVYTQKFRNILFQRKKVFSLSPIRLMQIIRMLPGIGFILVCYYMIYKKHGFYCLLMYILMLGITLFYIIYSRVYVIKEAQNNSEQRIRFVLERIRADAINQST